MPSQLSFTKTLSACLSFIQWWVYVCHATISTLLRSDKYHIVISNIPPLKLRIDFFCNDHLRCPAEENITFSLSWRWVKWESLNLCWPLITCMFSSVPASISDGDMIGLCSPVRIIPPSPLWFWSSLHSVVWALYFKAVACVNRNGTIFFILF